MSPIEAGKSKKRVRMSSEERDSTGELRMFGLLMASPLAGLGALLVWRSRAAGPWLLGLAAVFALLALLHPRPLAPVRKAWMRMAQVLSSVMTTVLLILTFFLVLTPIGLLVRAMRKDLLHLRINKGIDSYWVPVEREGPASRPNEPY
jgi:hypothetical protein